MNQPPYQPGPPQQYQQPQQYPPPQYQQPQQPPKKKGMSTCLIVGLVLVALAIPIIGVVAALGIYGTRKYIAAAKTAEAKNAVSQIALAAVTAYEREDAPALGSKTAAHHLCKSSVRVPAVPPKGVKYQPSSADGVDFNTGDATTGWKCLKFSMSSPMYYAYKYETGAGTGKSGATANGFEVTAQGDLNGDGVQSLFARGADIRNGSVVLGTSLYIENEFE